MSSMLFIDTNIYLDFYRYSNDLSLSLLKRVDNNRDIVITTAEVEMEYKKNRQKVILEALGSIRPQSSTQLNIPSFLKESKYKGTSVRLTKEWNELANRTVSRTEKLLESPGRYDPVYRILERLFKEKGACHLTRGKRMRLEIREKAQKRFILGYPPRKANDTSIGDSINWEWIVHCAKESQSDIVVISRDTDYGQHRKEKSFINDWLLQEFKERVGRARSIKLTTRLSEGFRLAGITIPEEEDQAEQKLITESVTQLRPGVATWQPTFSTATVPAWTVSGTTIPWTVSGTTVPWAVSGTAVPWTVSGAWTVPGTMDSNALQSSDKPADQKTVEDKSSDTPNSSEQENPEKPK